MTVQALPPGKFDKPALAFKLQLIYPKMDSVPVEAKVVIATVSYE